MQSQQSSSRPPVCPVGAAVAKDPIHALVRYVADGHKELAAWQRRARVAALREALRRLGSSAVRAAEERTGKTALHYASSSEVVRILAEFGADVNAVDNHGLTPIHVAATRGEGLVMALLACGASPRALDDQGRTPLHFAGSPGTILALCEAVRVCNDGVTDPDTAVAAYVCGRDLAGNTALHAAHSAGMAYALGRLASDSKEGRAAFVNMRDDLGRTALHSCWKRVVDPHACSHLVRALLNLGADVNAVDCECTEELRTALDYPCKHAKVPLDPSDDRFAVEPGSFTAWARVHQGIYPGLFTPLHYYLATHHDLAVQALIEAGASREAVSGEGLTPAQHGTKYGITNYLHLSMKMRMCRNEGFDKGFEGVELIEWHAKALQIARGAMPVEDVAAGCRGRMSHTAEAAPIAIQWRG